MKYILCLIVLSGCSNGYKDKDFVDYAKERCSAVNAKYAVVSYDGAISCIFELK